MLTIAFGIVLGFILLACLPAILTVFMFMVLGIFKLIGKLMPLILIGAVFLIVAKLTGK